MEKQTDEVEKIDTNAVYHTSEVYHHLGFTRETLRYYEEIGLIKPKRDPFSQYREFGFYDMSHLMAIDFYRKRGFTPVEIKNLLKAAASQEYEQILQEQSDCLQREIERLQGMQNRLRDANQFYHHAAEKNGTFEVRTMSSYCVKESINSVASFQEYREKVLNYLNLEEEDILSNMVRALTFDESGYQGSEMYIVTPLFKQEKEYGQEAEDKHLLIEGGKSLYTVLAADNNDDTIMEKMFALCQKWAIEHQTAFRGVVYIFIRFVVLNEQIDKNYYEIWMPLKE